MTYQLSDESRTNRRTAAIANESKRFWSKIDRSGGSDACWLWQGVLDKQGRGRFELANGGQNMLAHRHAWEDKRGAIPDGNRCRQDCGNFLCCNVSHMSLDCPFARLTVYKAKPGTFLGDVREFLGWLSSQNYADLTVETYGLVLEQFNRWLASDYPDVQSVAHLTRQHIRSFSLWLFESQTAAGQRITHDTRSKKLHAIRSMLKFFSRETDVVVLDWNRVTVPRGKRGADRNLSMPVSDLANKIDAFYYRARASSRPATTVSGGVPPATTTKRVTCDASATMQSAHWDSMASWEEEDLEGLEGYDTLCVCMYSEDEDDEPLPAAFAYLQQSPMTRMATN